MMKKAAIMIALSIATCAAHGQTILKKDDFELTERHIKLAHSLVTFMADGEPTEQEKLTLRAGLKKEFLEGPEDFITGVAEVEGILEEAKKLTNPMQVAFGRIALTSFYYGASQDWKPEDTPVILKVVFAKNPVLAYDKDNQIALTKKDLDASMRFLWFSNGVPEPTVAQKKEMKELADVISKNYLQMSVEEKQFLAVSAITMALVDYQWKQMTLAQKQQMMGAYNQNYSQAMTAGQIQAKPIPNWSQNQNLDGDTYKFLSRMSMQNHLSMMNGIESMGGSDDYWQIRPIDW